MAESLTQSFYLKEFDKLKDEQQKRIGFRDQMIYLTLGAIGTVFSFSLQTPNLDIALLVLPFICIILGWTYLTNDEKISSIGAYINKVLIPKLSSTSEMNSILENWETFLKNDQRRLARKKIQLYVDLSVFCLPSVISIFSFFAFHTNLFWYHGFLAFLESVMILYLAWQFVSYADIKKYLPPTD